MVRISLAVAAGVFIFLIIAFYTGLIGPYVDATTNVKSTQIDTTKFGNDLYAVAPFPAVSADAFKPHSEPIKLHGFTQIKDKQEVPSLVAGQILFIGVPVPDGAVEAAGLAPFLIEPYQYNWVNVDGGRVYKFYRRLLPNDEVYSDEVIGMVECSKALALLREKQVKISVTLNDEYSTKAAADEAASRYARDLVLYRQKGISAAELSQSQAAKDKFYFDWKSKSDTAESAKVELAQAHLLYTNHEIRNKVPYRRCVIQYIHKQRGDPVKEQDVVLTVHGLDHLQAEALVDASYLDRIKPEMTATIEPTQEVSPVRQFIGLHRGEVTAIAVTHDADAPRIVSAGTDHVANIRDVLGGGLPIRLDHEDVVRTLACTPVGAERNLCLSGAGDKIYVWDLDRSALGDGHKVAPVAIKDHAAEGDSSHVTCVAFSPDGKYFASGGDDGGIALWHTADLSLVYRFDSEHGVEQGHSDPITALTFTPQCRLVSASADKTIRIWQLKEKGVILDAAPIAGRDGNVPHIGVRADGKWFLFDRGNTLQFVSLERPGATFATLQNFGGVTPFETLAQFSPDGTMVLTAGLPEGKLQLWEAPTETSRGFSVRQYLPGDKHAAVTCAAFFPRHPFLVSGTAAGEVYFWSMPTETEIKGFRIKDVPVRLLSSSIDPNTSQARIAVDVSNLDGRLRPGRAVTVVIGDE